MIHNSVDFDYDFVEESPFAAAESRSCLPMRLVLAKPTCTRAVSIRTTVQPEELVLGGPFIEQHIRHDIVLAIVPEHRWSRRNR